MSPLMTVGRRRRSRAPDQTNANLQRSSGTFGLLLEPPCSASSNDNALSRSAAMAFYAATSLAPVLLIVIAIAGFVVGARCRRTGGVSATSWAAWASKGQIC